MHRFQLPRAALPEGFELSDDASARLEPSETHVGLDWDLALLLLAIGEDESARGAAATDWYRWRVPPWLDETDVEIIANAIVRQALPPATSNQLRLLRYGVAGKPSFRLSTEWLDAKGQGVATPSLAEGPIVARWNARLTLGQWLVVSEMERLPPLGQSEEADLRATEWVLSRIPPGDRSVALDAFLQREQVVEVKAIAPKLVPLADGTYQVRPVYEVEGMSQQDVESHFYASSSEQLGRGRIRLKLANGKRRNVFFAPEAAEALHTIRRHDRVEASTAALMLSSPQSFFAGPGFDLSKCAERVTGLGPIVLQPIDHGKEVEVTGWFDFETGAEGPVASSRYDLTDGEVRATLRRAINAADEAGASFIPNPWGAGLIEITAGLRAALERHEREADKRAEDRERQGLLVRSNLDEVEHMDVPTAPAEVAVPTPPVFSEGVGLRPWQLEGYRWLMRRMLEGRPGALLADDMGLGKTIQVLAMLVGLEALGRRGPHLVVAPLALTENWRDEVGKFLASRFGPVLVVDALDLRRSSSSLVADLQGQRLVIASYDQVRGHELVFARVDWDVVILDEAQRVKNPGTQVSRVVRALKARFRIACTGTPVENSLTELWTICDWLAPGHLGSLRAFRQRFIDRVRLEGSEARRAAALELQVLLKPLMLRRTKDAVLGTELKPIQHASRRVPLGAEQTLRYQALVKTKTVGQIGAFALLQRLFALCAHPDMRSGDEETVALSGAGFPKASALLEILDLIAAAGEKVLIFANRKHIQRWLARLVEERFRVEVPIVNGDITESRQRKNMVEFFGRRQGFGALVLAPRAAGVGLNITAANHVIHYMREWNPAIESQATGRAHRMGQLRPVQVYTLISEGGANGLTVEEKLAELLTKKQALMHEFVVPLGGLEITAEELLRLGA